MGEDDTSAKEVLRNEIVQHRMQPYPGGKPIAGSEQVNVLELADAVLLQWYSGFDAALCANMDDPKVLNVSKDGLISTYWSLNGSAGNMFPTTFPVRCNACSGTEGPNACSTPEEAWFRACE